MPAIVEGHVTNSGAMSTARQGADSWVDGLRRDVRRQMIKELALGRIRRGCSGDQPRQQSRASRFIEGVVVGVAVTLVSTWLSSVLSPLEEKR